ncbi:DUF1365 family protein [Nocardioides panacisoli]|uniref:FAD-dependent oxidoreductase n=1 Tax=Nocardioides panacisoli TaxID=627624 RepID=UPI001C629C6F|nr:FAD-dependent oxidoreductase [Nocardioides panacisoli]QYJ03175.1 DUF1365 family protein [Nocardioides panacisoli]
MDPHTPRRVAVVGSGVAGLTAAYVASRTAEVTLFEADDRLGGHADTHRVPDGDTGRELSIDSGFIVHNRRTYPVLLRLFDELGVPTQASEMSMSIRDGGSGLEWAGALGRRGLFPTSAHLRNPAHLRMLADIPRFHRQARRLLEADGGDPTAAHTTLAEFLDAGGFNAYFRRHFAEPLVAAVWSCDPAVAARYPAAYLFRFLDHHGMLSVFGSPTWRTVTGGSVAYVDRVADAVRAAGGKIHLGSRVVGIGETAEQVLVRTATSTEAFDAVVIATHPDQALASLDQPTAQQREVLGAMPYSSNPAVLHTDTSLLPEATNAWASWNFHRPVDGRDGVLVTYDLTRLQRLPTDTHYLVTLGGEDLIDPDTVIARRDYAHPLYTPESVAAQARLPEIDTDRIRFAGAYHGWGFHEDGARSGLTAVERLGLTWPEASRHRPASESGPREPETAYATTISHTRRSPFRRTFRHRSHLWVVDLDELPPRPRGAFFRGEFASRDHFDGTAPSIRAGLDRVLLDHGHDLRGGRALMAAQPRAFGYCFNPISVHWVWQDPEGVGVPDATVVEVHNTYGERHSYLIDTDEHGKGAVAKAMYVSPFHGTDGQYRISAPAPTADRLKVAVSLQPDHGARFDASVVGRRTTAPRLALAALRSSLLIRIHGSWLWLRGLPVQPRPLHDDHGVTS